MLDKVKVIAIAIVVVAAAVVGAFVITHHSSSKDYDIDAALQVYRNADQNYTIDSKDLDIINDIIMEKASFKDYPMADANQDGEVTGADAELVQKIINKESCTIYNVNTCSTGDYVVSTKWPCKSALSTGAANMLLMLTMTGIKDMVHGISYSASSKPDATLFPTFSKMTSLGSSSTKMTVDAAADIIKQYKVTVLISDKTASTISNEDAFEKAGVDVVRIAPALVDVDDATSQLLMLGFLFDTQTQCLSIAEWENNLIDEIDKKLEGVNKVSVITSNSGTTAKGAWISAGDSDYKNLVIAAGGEYALDDSVLTDYKSGAYFAEGDTWLYQYDFDYIVSIRTTGWYDGTIDAEAKYNDTMRLMSMTSAYQDGHAYVIVGDGPIPVRIAYAASVMYPDTFSEEWADSVNQEFFEKYYPIDIDFTGLFFTISYDDVYGSS